MDKNYIGWANFLAPVIMKNPDRPELGAGARRRASARPIPSSRAASPRRRSSPTTARDLAARARAVAHPAVLRRHHRADRRRRLSRREHLPASTLRVMQATGHCPHMSHPEETIAADEGISRAAAVGRVTPAARQTATPLLDTPAVRLVVSFADDGVDHDRATRRSLTCSATRVEELVGRARREAAHGGRPDLLPDASLSAAAAARQGGGDLSAAAHARTAATSARSCNAVAARARRRMVVDAIACCIAGARAAQVRGRAAPRASAKPRSANAALAARGASWSGERSCSSSRRSSSRCSSSSSRSRRPSSRRRARSFASPTKSCSSARGAGDARARRRRTRTRRRASSSRR